MKRVLRFTILLITAICVALTAGADLFAQDAENVEQVGRIYNQWDNANDVVVVGNLAYVAVGVSGLQIADLSDPEHPEEVGYYDTDGYAEGVTVSGDYAYIADWSYGLRVISVADPENPEEVGYYNTSGNARGVALSEDGLIYVADWTNVGIYRFTDPAKVDDSAVSFPVEFKLFPAYPNPFNSTTSISYSLDRDGFITLKLYDLSGREVTSLVNERQSAGHYSTIWNAEGLPSGVYLLRLNAGVRERTAKLVLIR